MKVYLIISIILFSITNGLLAQESELRELKPFTKVIVSPIVDVELVKGDKESIWIEASGVSISKVNTKVSGSTLRVFLDGARMSKRYEKVFDPDRPNFIFSRSRYHGAKVKVVLTYKELKKLQVRGDGDLICEDRLGNDKLKVKLMGEVNARIGSVDAKKFKLSMFGDNKIAIKGGAVDHQTYKSFGENRINTTRVNSLSTKVSVFGDATVKLSTDQRLKLSSFGESDISYSGKPRITKSLILGELHLRKF